MPKCKINLSKKTNQIQKNNSINLEINKQLIKEIFNNKLTFSIKETSEILNLSYDFIRKQIKKGNIQFLKFGDRAMISINELSNLLTYGLNTENKNEK